MSARLRNSPKIWKLAEDLGVKHVNDPVAGILRYCERKVRALLRDNSDCKSLSDLLDWLAAKLGTVFEIVKTDDDLSRIKEKYIGMEEKIFSHLDQELKDDVYGITFRRRNREGWEPEFVSVIDCRDSKASRAYYTKWHELSHLLVQTDQMRLAFRRTHCEGGVKDPEEALVDVVAGVFAFYSPIVHGHAKGEITFEKIDDLRERLCSEASTQASVIGFVRAWPGSCLLVHAQMAFKKAERAHLLQQKLEFAEPPVPALRAVHVTANDAAKELGMSIFENMRVPESSVIYRVFSADIEYEEAKEDLSWWQTSDGIRLRKQKVRVKAKRVGSSTYALIIPLD
jgi:hypothetical protein